MTIASPGDLVIDASIAIKWLVPEAFTAEARRFLGPEYRMNVPSFFAAECGNVFLKKALQRGEMTFEQARKNLAELLAKPRRTYNTDALAPAALDLALEVARPKLAIYDFIYLALAIQLDCGYLTADRVFFDAMQPTPHGSRMVWVADAI